MNPSLHSPSGIFPRNSSPFDLTGIDLTGVDLTGLDLSRHDSVVNRIIALNAAFIGAITVIVSARLYARLRIVRRIWADDSLIVFAGIFTIALSAVCITGTKFGLGRHEWDLDPATVLDSSKEIVKILIVCQVLYATAVTLTKISIIASYIRVFPTRTFHRFMYITAGVIVGFWVCSVLVTVFQCSPVRAAWDFTLKNKKCIPILHFFYAAQSVNIATDLILCIAPLPLCWKLRIGVNERIILCLLFAVGFFASAASAIRLSQLHNLRSIDFSYALVSSLNWSVVEVCTGIICASVPSLKPIARKVFPGRLSYSMSDWNRRQNPANGPSTNSEVVLNSNAHQMGSRLHEDAEFQKI